MKYGQVPVPAGPSWVSRICNTGVVHELTNLQALDQVYQTLKNKRLQMTSHIKAKCLMTDKDCVTGNEDWLATSEESNWVIH